MTVHAMFDNVLSRIVKLCHIFTKEKWFNLAGITNKCKNSIYQLVRTVFIILGD